MLRESLSPRQESTRLLNPRSPTVFMSGLGMIGAWVKVEYSTGSPIHVLPLFTPGHSGVPSVERPGRGLPV